MSHKKLMIFPVMGCALLLASCGSTSPEADENSTASPTESATPQAASPEPSSERVPPPEEFASPPPPMEYCPYHEEVSETPDDEQYELALDLGCEYDIYGGINFEEPVRVDGEDSTYSLTDPERAMSTEELEEAGYL